MTAKKKSFFTATVIKLLFFLPTLFGFVGNFFALVEIEARLAGRNLVTLLVLYLMLGSLLTSLWLCLLGLLFLYLITVQSSWALGLMIILVFNLLFLIIIGIIMIRLKNNLLFPETRNLLRHLRNQ